MTKLGKSILTVLFAGILTFSVPAFASPPAGFVPGNGPTVPPGYDDESSGAEEEPPTEEDTNLGEIDGKHWRNHAVAGTNAFLRGTVTVEQQDDGSFNWTGIPFCTDYRADGVECIGDSFIPKASQVKMECMGDNITTDGGWITNNESISEDNKLCFSELKYCYAKGTVAEVCYTISQASGEAIIKENGQLVTSIASIADIKPYKWTEGSQEIYTRCDSNSNNETFGKEYCAWNYVGNAPKADDTLPALGTNDTSSKRIRNAETGSTSGLTGRTGDDMFKLNRSSDGFLEYIDLKDVNPNYVLRYFHRGSAVNAAMIPAGPKSTYEDFINFVDNPSEGITVRKACQPASASLSCDTSGLTPAPVAGACGQATYDPDGTYMSLADVNSAEARSGNHYCFIGDKKNVSETADSITWACTGLFGGADSAQCVHTKSNDGRCGSAHLNEFADRLELEGTAQYCADGSPKIAGPSGSGPWGWTCGPTGDGGENAYCTAFKKGMDCRKFFENDNMVVVQDLSGSFYDDLGNTKTALSALFNDPLFTEWGVGIVGYKDFGDRYPYGIIKNVTTDKDVVTAAYNNLRASGGGDYPESQVYAMRQTVDDFSAQFNNEPFTMVMITDASAHTGGSYGTFADLKSRMDAKDASLIILGTSNVNGFYTSNMSSNGINGSFKTITSDSRNLASSLLSGLVEIGCESTP